MFPMFLSTLNSCTFASYGDVELEQELSSLALRAIAKFKFPKMALSYEADSEGRYYFINEVGHREIAVLVAWMKVFWLEYQLSKERHYENLYADKDVKAFSSGNLISSITKTYNELYIVAEKTEQEYGRINKDGKPSLGDINE